MIIDFGATGGAVRPPTMLRSQALVTGLFWIWIMAKALEAFRTISEVADELAVQKHVLRFWENKFPQVRPMKRGGGRRYYRPDDLDLLRGIRFLLHREGYTIKGVQKILREHGLEHVKSCWQVPTQRPTEAVTSTSATGPGRKSKMASGLMAQGAVEDPVTSVGTAPEPRKGASGKAKSVVPTGKPATLDAKMTSKGTETRKQLLLLIAELEACRGLLRGTDVEHVLPLRAARSGR